jgi:hypothetical protein
MKISKLLSTRQALLRQTQLANLAHAYMILRRTAARIATANLRGLVRLRPANPAEEAFWASLTALEGNQSVIEEHFADHELIELADAMGFALADDFHEIEFRLEEFNEKFALPLRQALENEGVNFDVETQQADVAAESGD